MRDTNSKEKDAEQAERDRLVAEYEAKNGPITTTAIVTHVDKHYYESTAQHKQRLATKNRGVGIQLPGSRPLGEGK